MEDIAFSPVLLERNNRDALMAELDPRRVSQSTSPTYEKRRPVSRRQAFRGDHSALAQTVHRQPKGASFTLNHEGDGSELAKNVPSANAYDACFNTFAKENIPRPVVRDLSPVGKRRSSEALDAPEKDSLSDAELVEYFAERMRQLPLMYGFKSPEPFNISQKAMLLNQHKSTKSTYSPLKRHNHQKDNASIESSSRNSSFNSKSQRKRFLPKIDVTPDHSEYHTTLTGPVITSSFRSSTERFPKKVGKVPGPGTYDRVISFPTHKQIGTYLSRGVYFSSSFS